MAFFFQVKLLNISLHRHLALAVGHVGDQHEGEGPHQVVELLSVEEAGHGPARPLDPHGGEESLGQVGVEDCSYNGQHSL